MHLDHAEFFTEECAFKTKLITRDHDTFEASVVNRSKIEKFLRISFAAHSCKSKHRTGLSHRFDDQNAGHDGNAGEVAGELRFVDSDVFDRNQLINTVRFQNSVN